MDVEELEASLNTVTEENAQMDNEGPTSVQVALDDDKQDNGVTAIKTTQIMAEYIATKLNATEWVWSFFHSILCILIIMILKYNMLI